MAQAISLVQTTDRTINQLQQNISQAVNPVLNNPLANGGLILTKQSLSAGSNTLNHGLGYALTGWFPVRFHGSWAQLFDTQDTNATPTKTLILNASAAVVADIYCF